jgi:hypothetical protein
VSYDFSKYQSQESEDRSAARGFRYNSSIENSREEKSNYAQSNMEPTGANNISINHQISKADVDVKKHNKVIDAHRSSFK